jgi:flagellar motor protein MotB
VNTMNSHRSLLMLAACLVPALARSGPVEEAILEPAERHLSDDQTFTRWAQDPAELDEERGDRLEVQQVAREKLETVKLRNVVPAIRFESGVAQIPPEYVTALSGILDGMRDRRNLRVHFVGHADSQPLSPTLARVFEDNAGLSRERAGEVAEYFKSVLDLPPDAISYEWAGDAQPVASNTSEEGRALNRRVEVEVWYDEVGTAMRDEEIVVAEDIRRVKVCRMETVCKMRYLEGHARRARIRNLVVPLRYDDETAAVPETYLTQVRQALDNLRDRRNVAVRFIGHTDDVPLTGRNERIYGDHLSLSRSRAHRVALAIQDKFGLPAASVQSDGRGLTQPVASNETAQGRALNRRVDVEFWYDDPLQELPDEPQLCPGEAGEEMVTKVYDPPWGGITPLALTHGEAVLPPGYAAQLARALSDVAGRNNPRLRFIGYTQNEHLDRRTAAVYGDDVGLSAARARRAKDEVLRDTALAGAAAEHEGRGYVHSDDVVNAGFIQGAESFVRVQVVYDEPAVNDDLEGVDIQRITRELTPESPFALNLMRITVDGNPIDDPARSSADIQRCTDVALDQADIRFRFDNLQSRPRLGVAAHPRAVHFSGHGESAVAPPVRFRMYANYGNFIDRAEIRVFESGRPVTATPAAVVDVDRAGLAEWLPGTEMLRSSHELKFVLRAYDASGNFDETDPQALWVYHESEQEPGTEPDVAAAAREESTPPVPPAERELLAGYGESGLALRNIPLGSGTVSVQGSSIPANHTVWVAGREVPVDAHGNFAAEEILPTGAHTVEVAVVDESGNGNLYLRDMEFKRKDTFYVGVADFTVSESRTNGPAELLQGANAATDLDSPVDGRLAFYLNTEFGEHWNVTASADTREGPVEDLFSNFLDKSPDALFRRIDPDNHYPTFGDDGIVEEMAATMGKFYVKASQGENHAMWGNFAVGYMGNELGQVDRGLYGANAHYASEQSTGFGERRFSIDGFAAEPGTMASYEQFRGTGGSLFYLRHQDLLGGSERVRIELRDKASGIVTGVVNLRYGTDYDIDYLQGRVLLSEPLSSTADDNLLVRTSGIGGDEAWLVVRYEFTPGFEELDAMAVGGQGHYWFNDHVKLGLTASNSDEGGADNSMNAADLMLRKSADTWLKLQAGRSEGLVSGMQRSDDGGFGFTGYDDLSFTEADAGAYRADVSVGLDDFFAGRDGRATLYTQTLDAGYSAPGLATLADTENFGGTFWMPLTPRLSVGAKGDRRTIDQGLESTAVEVNAGFQFTERLKMSAGARNDERIDNSPIVPLTQEQGERLDAVMQVDYDPGTSWRGYGFLQDTVSATGDREDNGRAGVGGSYRLTERLRIDTEVSDGDLGPGGRVGSSFLYSESTNLYLNYALENERGDNGMLMRRGNLVSGVKHRISDGSSVYFEERYQDSGAATGLTHATGISLAASEHWDLGANADIGTMTDSLTGAETERMAGGVRVGYGFENVQFSSAVEYRVDEAEQLDTSITERTTWLLRNSVRYQLSPDWRLTGKFDHAVSESSLGEFYDGGYTEAVVGYAYRPVDNDRFNALAKFTYFYNVPTTDQVTGQGVAAEFIQKSHIASFDLSYDLTERWTIGGKYAYRLGQMSLERENPEFFDNTAHLALLRADWRFREAWEGMLEVRALELPDLDERRSGALVAVYRYVGRNFKVGVGYNFTDFSEELTDLSYDHQGAFLNMIGAM